MNFNVNVNRQIDVRIESPVNLISPCLRRKLDQSLRNENITEFSRCAGVCLLLTSFYHFLQRNGDGKGRNKFWTCWNSTGEFPLKWYYSCINSGLEIVPVNGNCRGIGKKLFMMVFFIRVIAYICRKNELVSNKTKHREHCVEPLKKEVITTKVVW